MLCTVGDLVEDVVVWLPRDPIRGSDTSARIFRRRGGSAANVAALAAAAGGTSRFIGQVGADQAGASLVDDLVQVGVETRVTTKGRTGTVVVLVDHEGERTMITDRGAATQLAALPDDALDGVTTLHVPAYSFVVDPLASVALDAIGEAVERGIDVSIDASSLEVIADFGANEFLDLMRTLRPSILFCNRDEAKALGLRSREPAPGPRVTVIKNGPRPTLIVRADGNARSVEVPPAEHVVDTTGAGDAFAAGYLLARMANENHKTAAQAGHLTAAQVLASPGATFGARAS